MGFSTIDKDNDYARSFNCAEYYGGANWWRFPDHNNINGKYGDSGGSGDGDSEDNGDGGESMHWYHFDNNNNYMALKSMTLMFRQAD